MARTKLGERYVIREERGHNALVTFIVIRTEKHTGSISRDRLAQKIGMTPSALYRRLSGATRFSHAEICRIIQVLNPTDEEILSFFGRGSQKGRKGKTA